VSFFAPQGKSCPQFDRQAVPTAACLRKARAGVVRQRYGPVDGADVDSFLENEVRRIQEERPGITVEIVRSELIPDARGVVVFTPLMRRALCGIEAAEDIIFVDGTHGTTQDTAVQQYSFFTASQCGGLPVGVCLTSSKSKDFLTALFTSFKSVLPSNAFGKRGRQSGPRLFMCDDESGLHTALLLVRRLTNRPLADSVSE
jgi:hypothetical protein